MGLPGRGAWRRLIVCTMVLPGAIVAYLIAAVLGALLPNGADGGGTGRVTVHLVAGPIHYDFLLPADAQTRRDFAFAEAAGVPLGAPGVEWIVVGWGSEAFYTATGSYADLRVRTVWRAAVGDGSVVRVSVAGRLGARESQVLRLTKAEYARLRAAILASVETPVPVPGAGLSAFDAFFPAKGRFHVLRTCNVWVAGVMRSAGLRFGRWTPTPYAVTLAARVFQRG